MKSFFFAQTEVDPAEAISQLNQTVTDLLPYVLALVAGFVLFRIVRQILDPDAAFRVDYNSDEDDCYPLRDEEAAEYEMACASFEAGNTASGNYYYVNESGVHRYGDAGDDPFDYEASAREYSSDVDRNNDENAAYLTPDEQEGIRQGYDLEEIREMEEQHWAEADR